MVFSGRLMLVVSIPSFLDIAGKREDLTHLSSEKSWSAIPKKLTTGIPRRFSNPFPKI